jgi:hypothetical protein
MTAPGVAPIVLVAEEEVARRPACLSCSVAKRKAKQPPRAGRGVCNAPIRVSRNLRISAEGVRSENAETFQHLMRRRGWGVGWSEEQDAWWL